MRGGEEERRARGMRDECRGAKRKIETHGTDDYQNSGIVAASQRNLLIYKLDVMRGSDNSVLHTAPVLRFDCFCKYLPLYSNEPFFATQRSHALGTTICWNAVLGIRRFMDTHTMRNLNNNLYNQSEQVWETSTILHFLVSHSRLRMTAAGARLVHDQFWIADVPNR